MKHPKSPARRAAFTEDDLFQIEIKVAQRADQLSEKAGGVRGKDREHWLQAEREVLHSDCRPPRPIAP